MWTSVFPRRFHPSAWADFEEFYPPEGVSRVSLQHNFVKQNCKSSLSLNRGRNWGLSMSARNTSTSEHELHHKRSMAFCTKKGDVHGINYHKERNYFSHINDKPILKKIGFSSAEVVSDLGILCWCRGNPVSNSAFMMLCQRSPLSKRGLSNPYLRKEVRLSSNSFLLKCSLM